jgi:alpha-beta hydrolase superfamily lysophospholipase
MGQTDVNDPMTALETTLTLPDGRARPLTVWEPAGAPRAAVLALHAYGDNRHGFAPFASRFAAAGFRVWAYDHRGFGAGDIRSRPFPSIERLVADALSAAGQLQATAPAAPLILAGESMGGGVALALAATGQLAPAALLLAAPAVRGAIPGRYAWNVGLWLGKTLAPWVGVTVNRDLTVMHDRAARRFGQDDAIVRFVTIADYYGIIRLADRAADDAPKVKAPAFIGWGTTDNIVPRISIEALARSLGGPCEVKVYDGGPHGLLQWSGHARVEADMLAFLAAHVG